MHEIRPGIGDNQRRRRAGQGDRNTSRTGRNSTATCSTTSNVQKSAGRSSGGSIERRCGSMLGRSRWATSSSTSRSIWLKHSIGRPSPGAWGPPPGLMRVGAHMPLLLCSGEPTPALRGAGFPACRFAPLLRRCGGGISLVNLTHGVAVGYFISPFHGLCNMLLWTHGVAVGCLISPLRGCKPCWYSILSVFIPAVGRRGHCRNPAHHLQFRLDSYCPSGISGSVMIERGRRYLRNEHG